MFDAVCWLRVMLHFFRFALHASSLDLHSLSLCHSQMAGIVQTSTGPDAQTRRLQYEKFQKELKGAMQKFQSCSQVGWCARALSQLA